jgi:hypothetical protein
MFYDRNLINDFNLFFGLYLLVFYYQIISRGVKNE